MLAIDYTNCRALPLTPPWKRCQCEAEATVITTALCMRTLRTSCRQSFFPSQYTCAHAPPDACRCMFACQCNMVVLDHVTTLDVSEVCDVIKDNSNQQNNSEAHCSTLARV